MGGLRPPFYLLTPSASGGLRPPCYLLTPRRSLPHLLRNPKTSQMPGGAPQLQIRARLELGGDGGSVGVSEPASSLAATAATQVHRRARTSSLVQWTSSSDIAPTLLLDIGLLAPITVGCGTVSPVVEPGGARFAGGEPSSPGQAGASRVAGGAGRCWGLGVVRCCEPCVA